MMRTELPDRLTVRINEDQKKAILAMMNEGDKGQYQRWFDRALMQLKEMNLQKKAS